MTNAEKFILDAVSSLLLAKQSDSFVRLSPHEQTTVLDAEHYLLQIVIDGVIKKKTGTVTK